MDFFDAVVGVSMPEEDRARVAAVSAVYDATRAVATLWGEGHPVPEQTADPRLAQPVGDAATMFMGTRAPARAAVGGRLQVLPAWFPTAWGAVFRPVAGAALQRRALNAGLSAEVAREVRAVGSAEALFARLGIAQCLEGVLFAQQPSRSPLLVARAIWMVGQDGRLRDEADPVFRPRFDIAITGASGPLDPSVERFTISLAYPLLYLRAALGRGENVHVVPLQSTTTSPRFEMDWRNHS